jgi:hypothetical protein
MTTKGGDEPSVEVNPSFLARLDTVLMYLTICWQVLFSIVLSLPHGREILETPEKAERLFNYTAITSLTILPLTLFILNQVLYYLIKGSPRGDDKKHFDEEYGFWWLVWIIALGYPALKIYCAANGIIGPP